MNENETNWSALNSEDKRRAEQEREEQRMEHYRMKRAERQAWNPDGCEPEPDFPVEVLKRQE